MTSADPNLRTKTPRLVVGLGAVLLLGLIGYWIFEAYRVSKISSEAIAAFRERKLDQAETAIGRWIEVEPRSGEPWYWKARVELGREHPQETMDALRKAQSLGYREADLQVISAVMQVYAGKYDQMEPILKNALDESRDPEPELAKALSRVYLANFQFALATKTLLRWMKDAPDDPTPYLWRNEVDERTSGDAAPVVRNYREALRRDPSLVDARLGLADRLRFSRRADEALKEYQTYLKLKPQSVEANRGAGQSALELGDTAAAIRSFHAVLENNPNEPIALRELALLDIRSGQYEKACERLKKAIEVERFDPDLRFNLAKALKLAGKAKESDEAAADTERLRKDQTYMNDLRDQLVSNPNDTNLQLKAARWLLEHGHDKEGLQWTDLILKAKPADRETCLLLADYHTSKKNFGLANYYRLAASPSSQPSPR